MAVGVFLDTSVLLAGLIDFGPQSAPAQSLLSAVAEKRVTAVATAWHCCLEFFSVATRLPPEYRIGPSDAATLIEQEVFARMAVHDLPATERVALLSAASRDAIAFAIAAWSRIVCSARSCVWKCCCSRPHNSAR